MNKECTLEERHSATRGRQSVHKSSLDNTPQSLVLLFPNKECRGKSFYKPKNDSMHPEAETFKLPNDNNLEDELEDCPLYENNNANSLVEDQSPSFSKRTKNKKESFPRPSKFPFMNAKSLSASFIPIQKEIEKDLKGKLADSLSPSPFRREDVSKRDAKLEEFVASAPCTTRTLLSSTFYDGELMGDNGHRVWKIALKDYIANTLEALSIIKLLEPVPVKSIEKRRISIDTKGKKLVVFDLDETLVHCNTDNILNSDKIITVTLNNGEQVKAGVNIRPYAIECLKELAEYYELIVFTASHPCYANVVIDLLDPEQNIFSKRLFRSSCIQTDINVFIKDLRILDYDPKTTVIIDNSILSFATQLDNGIPIVPFYDDKEDRILLKIKDYLLSLKDVQDVRVINRKNFSLTELYNLNLCSIIKFYKKHSDEIEDTKEVVTEEREELNHTKMKSERKKSYSLRESNSMLIGEEAQAEVDDQLKKLQESLPKYLARQEKI